MRYVLGLDIGIASVGWAVLELDSFDEPFKIVDLNSRIFLRPKILMMVLLWRSHAGKQEEIGVD